MKLRDLVVGEFPEVAHRMTGSTGDIEIDELSCDSRAVKPGTLFVALLGSNVDGAHYIHEATTRGAAAVISAHQVHSTVPVLVVANPRQFLARAAARMSPGQPHTFVAVTGTAGKTSVVSFTRQIWALAGYEAAQIGTTGVAAPRRNEYGVRTTPDPIKLHRILSDLRHDGVTHAAMEASSHGIDQCRLDGVRLTAGGFTNLGRDHMDYHPSIEHYMAAKMRLFDALLPRGAPAVVFADGEASQKAASTAKKAGLDVRTVGRGGTYLLLEDLKPVRQKQIVRIRFRDQILNASIPLVGEFQVANVLVALGLAISTGVAPEVAIAATETLIGAPGRLEFIGATAGGAPVYVDYAHKPEALEAVLSTARVFTTGRLIVVFGCGGDRDRGKRRSMGEVAAKLADIVIVTDDNPRSERPEQIRSAIIEAAPGAIEIEDRSIAIAEAIRMLRPGDALIVAGKGHEEGQIIVTARLLPRRFRFDASDEFLVIDEVFEEVVPFV
ncbi:UDP-N-acetylmuramoyl-L-alanyl-D-glutamate--2,6-diaminopimelate ligase, partial [Sinorhizobium sp. 7-81]|uniref:UDP-N-acetylmuramoyl-L-alanyl-D-glutamate--2, 6-diaminopimelate ligase n=1 Tax=Sinorhizobium sp. 8-89 TaxID=3049089 RepID=UPI0024C2BB6B